MTLPNRNGIDAEIAMTDTIEKTVYSKREAQIVKASRRRWQDRLKKFAEKLDEVISNPDHQRADFFDLRDRYIHLWYDEEMLAEDFIGFREICVSAAVDPEFGTGFRKHEAVDSFRFIAALAAPEGRAIIDKALAVSLRSLKPAFDVAPSVPRPKKVETFVRDALEKMEPPVKFDTNAVTIAGQEPVYKPSPQQLKNNSIARKLKMTLGTLHLLMRIDADPEGRASGKDFGSSDVDQRQALWRRDLVDRGETERHPYYLNEAGRKVAAKARELGWRG